MKTPELSRVLKAAKDMGLCGPVTDQLENFLKEKDDKKGPSNLERLSSVSRNLRQLEDLVWRDFAAYLVAKRFQVAIC